MSDLGFLGGYVPRPEDDEVPAQRVAPGPRHIEALQANPDFAADFDAKFGAGQSARYLSQPAKAKASPTNVSEPTTYQPTVTWSTEDILKAQKPENPLEPMANAFVDGEMRKMQRTRDTAALTSVDAFMRGPAPKDQVGWLDDEINSADHSVAYWERQRREHQGAQLAYQPDYERAVSRLEAAKKAKEDLDGGVSRQAEPEIQVAIASKIADQKLRVAYAEDQLEAMKAGTEFEPERIAAYAETLRQERKRMNALEQAMEYATQRAAAPGASFSGEMGRSFLRALTADTPEMLAGAVQQFASTYGGEAASVLKEVAGDAKTWAKGLKQDFSAPKSSEILALDPKSPEFARDVKLYVAHSLGQGFGSSAAFLAAAVGGGIPGATGMGLSLGVGQMRNALEEEFSKEGLRLEDHNVDQIVYGFGSVIGLLDTAGNLFNFGMLSGSVKQTAIRSAAAALARGAAKGALVEGMTEGAQEAVQIMGENYALNRGIDWEKFSKRVVESAAGGAIPGAAMGARTGVLENSHAARRKAFEDLREQIEAETKVEARPVESVPAEAAQAEPATEASKGGRPLPPVAAEARDPATIPRPEPVPPQPETQSELSTAEKTDLVDVAKEAGLSQEGDDTVAVIQKMREERANGASFGEFDKVLDRMTEVEAADEQQRAQDATIQPEEVEGFVDMWRYVEEAGKVPPPEGLASFLRRAGGLADYQSELRSMLGEYNKRPGLVSKTGLTLDDATLLAWQHGFLQSTERPEINHLLEQLDRDLRGEPVVRGADQGALEDWRAMGQMQAELGQLGITKGMKEADVRAILKGTAREGGEGAQGRATGGGSQGPSTIEQVLQGEALTGYLEDGGSLDLRDSATLAEALGVERNQVVPVLEEAVRQGLVRKHDGRYWRVDDPAADFAVNGRPVDSSAVALAQEEQIQGLVREKIARGEPVKIPKRITQSLLDAMGVAAGPTTVPIGAISRIEPAARPGDVMVTFMRRDGSEVTNHMVLNQLFRMRAFFNRTSGSVLSARLFLPKEFGPTLAGEARHEILHARWAQLDPVVRDRLLAHAQALSVLDMQLGTYLKVIKDPTAAFSDPTTLRDAYGSLYENTSDLADRLNQEAVAHMLELIEHGHFTEAEIAPIRDALAEYDGPAIVKDGQPVTADIMAALRHGDKITLDEKIANQRAIDDFVETLPPEQRRSLTDDFDVIVNRSGYHMRYDIVKKGAALWTESGSPNSLGSFIVKPAQRVNVRGVEVTNARLHLERMRRQGLGSAIYDMIDRDFEALGGLSPSPGGQLSDAAKAFWTKRLGNADIMAALRGADRAMSVVDRAARMAKYGAGFSWRGLLDPQMRTPGYIETEPFDLSSVVVRSRSVEDVPLTSVRTVQPTVSIRAVKDKIAESVSDDGRLPSVFKWGDGYYVNDGNHRIVAAKAQGHASIRAEVIELAPKIAQDPGSSNAQTQLVGSEADHARGIMAALRGSIANRQLPDGQTRVPKPGVDAPKKSLGELVSELNTALGLTTRLGRLNPGLKAQASAAGGTLRGQYNTATGVTRLAVPQDIETLSHEGGHALEERFGVPLRMIMEAHAAEIEKLATPGPDALSEGFAEFFRRYVTNPKAAETRAPKFSMAFERFTELVEPGLLERLHSVTDGYQDWINAPSGGAVASTIKSAKKDGLVAEMTDHVRRNGFRNAAVDYFHGAYTALIDGLHPVKMAVDQLIDIANTNLATPLSKRGEIGVIAARDPYKLLRLARNAYQGGHLDLMRGVRDYHSAEHRGPSLHDAIGIAMGGFESSQWSAENVKAFGAYLISRRMVAEWNRFKGGELEGPPDKLSQADHIQAQKDFEAAHPQFIDAAEMVYTYQKNLLRKARDAGFVSVETYDDLIKRQDYVPAQRDMSEDNKEVLEGAGASTKGTNKQRLLKQFRGSTRDIINPLETIARTTYEWNFIIARNDAIKALDRLARAVGPGGGQIAERVPANQLTGTQVNAIEVVKRAGKQAGVDEADMLFMTQALEEALGDDADTVIFTPGQMTEKGEPIVYLWEDGKRVALRLADGEFGKDMYEAITGLGLEKMNWFAEALAKPSQWLRAGVTLDPAFVAANWIRDNPAAWMNSSDHGAWFPRFDRSLKASGDALAAAFGRQVDDLDTLASAGGIIGGAGLEGMRAARVNRDIEALRKKGIKISEALPHNKEFWELTGVTETGTRLSVFRKARERALADGLDEYEATIEAAYTANDLIDFGRHGSKMLVVRRLVTFLNAMLQGTDKSLRVASGQSEPKAAIQDVISPYVRQSDGQALTVLERQRVPLAAQFWAKFVTIGFIGAALAFSYRDDPEWEEIPEYFRTTHWMFKDPSGTWRRIPKPFELGAMSLVMERTFEAMWKGDKKAAERMMSGLADLVTPPHVVPGVQIAYELWANKSKFTGAPIVPQQLEKLPPELQFTAYTSEFSKWMAINTGLSAAKIDHAIAGVTGSLGKSLLDTSNAVMPPVGAFLKERGLPTLNISDRPRPELRQSDTIFIRRFTVDPARSSQSKKDFWKEMSTTNGEMAVKAGGYKEFYDRGQFDEAGETLKRMKEHERVYALLEGHGTTYDKRMHPMNRARDVLTVSNGIRRDLDTGKLKDDQGNAYSPSDRRVIQETIENLQMREARNAQIVMGVPGYAHLKIMPTEPTLKELEAKVPSLFEELDFRLRKKKVQDFDAVRAEYIDLKARVLEPDYAAENTPRRKVGRRAP